MTKADILNRLKNMHDECSDAKIKDSILNLIVDIGSEDDFSKPNPTITNLPYYSYKSEKNGTGKRISKDVIVEN